MLQAQLANDFGRRLGCDTAYLVEEWNASHSHRCCHLVQTDLSATHVLKDELFYVSHELLVHQRVHRVVANGVAVIVLRQQIARCRRLGNRLVSLHILNGLCGFAVV